MSDFTLDDELVSEYLAESREHLATIEADLLSMERAGAAIDEELVNRVFRAAHSIKGGAGFFDLLKIKELAHKTENVLDLVRSGQLAPDSQLVGILLLAFDKLRALIVDHRASNAADISEFTAALVRLTIATADPSPVESGPEALAPRTGFETGSPAKPAPETTIRLNVALLDSLMTLAGELVLSRNQLNEAVSQQDERGIRAGAHRVSLVTSELQEAVGLTRMQPVGTLFAKFPRLVRDLASELGKEIELKLEGGDVELDKTILEGLSDPLTHMVRNAVDHGIEPPAARVLSGKPPAGTITLHARHQAGQVVIEISDDGKGLSAEKIAASTLARGLITAEQLQTMPEHDKLALIFLPGVSTAEKVSSVSGRGVGMDVVRTNLDKLGGKVDIESVPGQGSSFRIKLPLTLAIIPSLLISESGERFAIPQVSVGELIRIPAAQIAERIDRAGDAEVLLLRDRLVPLLRLADALGKPRPELGSKAMNIVLVDTGLFEYGLVVEGLHDTVEIVVKPLGRHMQGLRDYAGATILGDGRVAVILDVAGLALRTGLANAAGGLSASLQATADTAAGETYSLLLFHNAPDEPCAVPIELVTRIERVLPAQVENLGGRRSMHYRGASLPLITLHDVASASELRPNQQWVVIVFERAGRPLGLLAAEPLDMIETELALDTVTLRQPGLAGSAILQGRTTLLLDIFELVETVRRRWPEPSLVQEVPLAPASPRATVLVVEDSEFFRGQIKRLIETAGYRVLAAEDGQAAWELLDHRPPDINVAIDVVVTDLEMPRMDGLALTKRIRADSRFTSLPVIALSSLAGEVEIARGLAAGVNEYQVKLDQDRLLASIRRATVPNKN